jgi:hypothetical protein
MGWYSVLSKELSLLRAGPLLVGLSFSNLHQLCDSLLLFKEHMAELSTYISTNVVRLPTLGWIAISVLVRGTYLELVANFGTDSFPMLGF